MIIIIIKKEKYGHGRAIRRQNMETCRNRKVRVTIGTAEQNKRGDKNMLSQMNYRKKHSPTVMSFSAEHSRFRDRPAEYRAGVLPLA